MSADPMQLALAALRANNQWHIDYDDTGSYADSALQLQTQAAIDAIVAAEGDPVAWMLVAKNGQREARVLYEHSKDALTAYDIERPADAPHALIPLYIARPPAAKAEVPKAMRVKPHCDQFDVGYARGWNACRDAMLAADQAERF